VPADQCVFFYECANCHVVLRPKPQDCCVFCSYGTEPCLSSKIRTQPQPLRHS
jgi:hypothetical protein